MYFLKPSRASSAGYASVGVTQADDRQRCDALSPTDKAYALARAGLHVDTTGRDSQRARQTLADRLAAGTQLGALHHDGCVDVDELQALRHDASEHRLKQLNRVRVAIALVIVGKVLADVAQACRTQQRVDHRMGKHIGVGVSVEAILAGDLNASQDQLATGHEPVGVIADAAEGAHVTRARIGSTRRSRCANTHNSSTPALSSSSRAWS